ncbi:MAG: Flp pilus assembly complex ATPase component TadA [Nanoarchaeota archaeon]|nr:Flp pilus assembly complex ATPase component TadA [Nanoarchaeota archaeon]
MLFKQGTQLYAYEIMREAGESVMYVNYLGSSFVPSISDSRDVMNRAVDSLIESPNVSRIVFVQQRNYNYDFSQISYLLEIAQLYTYLTKQEKILSSERIAFCQQCLGKRHENMTYIAFIIKQDILAAYHEVKRFLREARQEFETVRQGCKTCDMSYIRLLEKILVLMEQTRIVKESRQYLENYVFGDRTIYQNFFRPDIIPNFTFTRLVATLPEDAEIVEQYEIASGYDKSVVTILKKKNEPKYIYHLMPPEYSLDEEYHLLLNLARNVLIEHRPKAEEFTDIDRTRQVFFNVSRDLLQELAESKKISLSYLKLNTLANILVRHTIGFGLVEVLLQDSRLQDIVLNAPISLNPVFVRHAEFDECVTNIIPSQEDADSWAAKFRMLSGRPLDEANPILDTDLSLGKIRARVAVIQQPLSPSGLAYALRRHREDPWTLPLFIKNKMINSFSAGLLSFLVDGARTMLVAGTRSSGKCVDGNTLIQLSDGSIKKIKELAGKEKRKIDDGFIYEPAFDFYSKSLVNLDIGDKKITDVWKRNSPEKLVRIRTKTGKEIITTKEHPYFLHNSRMINKRADELKTGDLIATPRNLKINGQNIFIDLKNSCCLVKESEEDYIFKGRTNSLYFKFPKILTRELAEFIGYLIGDGHISETGVTFFNSNDEIRRRYKKLIEMFGLKYREYKTRTTRAVQISCRDFARVINQVFGVPFGRKSDKIVIPELILKADNYTLSGFLRAYFDCDGYVSKKNRLIEISTASKEMHEYLRLALLRFGITCCSKRKEIKGVFYHSNFIYGEFVNEFAKSIGFNHPDKKQKLDRFLSVKFMPNTNLDTIPQGNEILKELRQRFRVSPQQLRVSGKDYWAYENNQHRVSRHWFKKLIDFYKQRLEGLMSFKESAESLRNIANFDARNYFEDLEKLRRVLRLSYMAIAEDIGISERGVRKILNNQSTGNLDILNNFLRCKIFSQQLEKMRNLFNEGAGIACLPLLVNGGIISYASVSKQAGIPESSLKGYCTGGNVPSERRQLIEDIVCKLRFNLAREITEAEAIVKSFEQSFLRQVSLGIILANFRNFLNIQDEEMAKEVSLTSVSNFFNGRYVSSFSTLKSIIAGILKIYSESISEKNIEFLERAEKLANSDIFWDEVVEADEIDKVDECVYDLSVEDTHNFVANGIIAHNTSMLGALMLEIMPKFRVIVIEDTLELPVDSLRKIGYDILRMKVRSAMLQNTTEVSADEGIRTSLRFGDSCLIIGEVRSQEARALYEAMRVGALANVVAGTIHGASPYAIFDRVVNDLGVPVTSFKATDCVLVANPVKSASGMQSWRRVVQLAEVRKHWTKDPLEEKGFVDLLNYNVEKDELVPSSELINGDSEVIKDIASNVKGWAGNWDAVYDNILLRARIKQELVDISEKLKIPDLLEAKFNSLANAVFFEISDEVRKEIGLPVGERVFSEWQKWLRKETRRLAI